MNKNNSILVVCGDPFYRQKTKTELISSIGSDTKLVELDSPSIDELAKELLILPLFVERKFVWVTNFEFDKSAEELFDKIGKLDWGSIPWSLVIEEDDIRKGKGLASRLTKAVPNGTVNLKSCSRCSKPTEGHDFVLDEIAPSLGVKIDRDAAKLLVDLCGCDYLTINSEIEKLALLSDGRVLGVNDVALIVSQIGDTEDFLNLYLSILSGDSVAAIAHSRAIIQSTGPESVFACIMKLMEAAVIIAYIGDRDKGFDFAKKKRTAIQKGTVNKFLWSGTSKEQNGKPPTPFLYKVAEKIAGRTGCKKQTLALYRRCYDSFVKFRLTSNLSLASAQIDEVVFVMCRR